MEGARTCGRLGLSKRVKNLVEGEQVLAYTEEVVRIYPDGRRELKESKKVFESSVKKVESGERCPRYMVMDYEEGDDLTEPLWKYIFSDGRVYHEQYHSVSIPGWEFDYLVLVDDEGIVQEYRWTLDDIKKSWPRLYEYLQSRGYAGLPE